MITSIAWATTMIALFFARGTVAAPFHDVPVVEGLEVAARGGPRPRRPRPGRAAGAGCRAGACRSCRFPATRGCRGTARPRTPGAPRRGRLPDVGADLGDDRGGGQRPDPGIVTSRSRAARKGCIIASTWASSAAIMPSRWSRWSRCSRHSMRVVFPEPALQRHRQVRDLGPHPPDGQVRQHLAAPLPVDQRLDHRPSRLRRDGPGHRVDLDTGVLQHVPEPVRSR